MTADAGRGPSNPRARRPGATILTAVAVGIADQDADPPAPSAAAQTEPSTPATSDAPGAESTSPAGIPAQSANDTSASPSGSGSSVPLALPASVSIPAIGVTSELITLGLNPDGTLAVPQPGPDYDKAAWFDGSPRPGDAGPAVIEGHVDSAANGPSIFYRLGELVVGDTVDVTRDDGTVVSFVVDEVRVVPKDAFPTFDVYGNTDGPELRLITCGGPFDSAAGSYVDNVVVFASLAP